MVEQDTSNIGIRVRILDKIYNILSFDNILYKKYIL